MPSASVPTPAAGDVLPAPTRAQVARRTATAVRAVPGVVDLHPGTAAVAPPGLAARGVIVVAAPGGRWDVRVIVVAELTDLRELARAVRTAVVGDTGEHVFGTIDVVVADVADGPGRVR